MNKPIFPIFRKPSGRAAAAGFFLAVLVTPDAGQGQGTFVPFSWPRVYDQQCTLTGHEGDMLRASVYILNETPVGQSFTPTLSQIDFLQVCMRSAFGAPFTVNLREQSITGPIVASFQPISPSWNIILHYAEFDFASPVAVVPGRKYVFELVQNGQGAWPITYYQANEVDYAGGTAIWRGREMPGVDFWFREGVVVPEPSSVVLLLLGGGVLWAARRWCLRQGGPFL